MLNYLKTLISQFLTEEPYQFYIRSYAYDSIEIKIAPSVSYWDAKESLENILGQVAYELPSFNDHTFYYEPVGFNVKKVIGLLKTNLEKLGYTVKV